MSFKTMGKWKCLQLHKRPMVPKCLESEVS